MNTLITVVGVGALGSHLIQFLRNENVLISAIDFDRVEQKNIAAQFFSKGQIGKLKSQAIRDMSVFLWGNKTIPCTSKLTQDNVEALLGLDNDSLVVDCLDNGVGRRLLQDHVRKYNIPCVHGALAADGTYGRIIWDKDFEVDDETVAGQATCEGGEHLPFIGLVSCLLAKSVQTWVHEGKHIGYLVNPRGVTRI